MSPDPARPAQLHDAPVPARDWLLLGLLSTLWGGSFFFYKLLAPLLPPFTLVLGRVGIAAGMLWLVLLLRRTPLALTWRHSGSLLLLSVLNCALPFSLFAWSEHRLPSGLAALLNAPTPILTAIVAHLATRDERLTRRSLAGVLCGFLGVAVLIGPDLPRSLAGSDLTAELACLLASLSYAFGAVLGRRYRSIPPLQFAAGQMAAATVVMLPTAGAFDRFWTLPALPASGWAALLGIALLSTAIAYLLYFRIVASSGATRAALVTFLVPVSALVLGWLFLGEHPGPRDAPGILLIGAGLVVTDGRLLRRLRPAPRRQRRSRM